MPVPTTVLDLDGAQILYEDLRKRAARADGNFADNYQTNQAYAVGDICIYQDKCYRCNTAIAAPGETWNAAHWTNIKFADYLDESISAVLSALNQKQTAPSSPGTAGQVLGLDSNLDPVWTDQTGGDESGLAPVIKSTASGQIASFADGADGRNIDSLVVNITPVQDLHGYDSPWPAGGGANKLPPNASPAKTRTQNGLTCVADDSGKFTFSGTLSGGVFDQTFLLPQTYVIEDGDYLHLCNSASNASAIMYLMFTEGSVYKYFSTVNALVSLSEYIGKTIDKIRFYIASTYNGTVSPMIVKSSSATAFAPYSNICPISGWTGANVQVDGANLWDEEWEAGSINASGQPQTSTTRIRSKNYISVRPETEYRYYNGASVPADIFYYKNDNTFISSERITTGTAGTSKVFTTPALCTKIKFAPTSSYGTTYNHDISINYPSSDTSYHAYQGRTIPVSWETEAGTVYGGQDEVISGAMQVSMAAVDMGTLTWTASQSNPGVFVCTQIQNHALTTGINILCSNYKAVSAGQYSLSTMPDKTVKTNATYAEYVYIKDTTYSDAATFKAAMSGVQLVYALAEPVSYQLSENSPTTLLGKNNIFADCGSIASVEYSADTKTYVDDSVPSVPVQDVQVNGTSVLGANGVANIPTGNGLTFGDGVLKIKTDAYSPFSFNNGSVRLNPAPYSVIKDPDAAGSYGYNVSRAITPSVQQSAVFFGLAKAAGDTTQSASENAVGTYTDAAKAAIKAMLGVPVWQSIMLTESDYDSTVGAFVLDVGNGNEIAEARVYGQIVWSEAPSSATIRVGFGNKKDVVTYNVFSAKGGIANARRIALSAEGKNIVFTDGTSTYRTQYGYGYYGTSSNSSASINIDTSCNNAMENRATCPYWNYNNPRYFSIYAPEGATFARLYVEYVLR